MLYQVTQSHNHVIIIDFALRSNFDKHVSRYKRRYNCSVGEKPPKPEQKIIEENQFVYK